MSNANDRGQNRGVPQIFTEAEALRVMRVSRATLFRARRRGEIGYFRIGSRVIYSKDHILAFMMKSERAAFTPKVASRSEDQQ